SGIDASVLRTIEGSPDDRLGASLDEIGDLDGDGVPDILAGAPGLQHPSSPGHVRIYSGADGRELLTLTGESAPEGFGDVVAGMGDVDGDSVPDVAVAAAGGDLAIPGAVRVFSGASGQILWRAFGNGPQDSFGRSIALLGDIDGDGVRDLAVGAP